MESKLQIISGIFRGRKLRLPPNARPTQNRARIALFNMLESLGVRPVRVWDAFAGSGAFGIECLSRYGDASAVFSDINPVTVRGNVAALNIGARASVVGADAMNVIDRYGATSDLIFVDPPYADSAIGVDFVRRLGDVSPVGTIVIWEQDAPNAATPDSDAWDILRDKQYGRARFIIMRRAGE